MNMRAIFFLISMISYCDMYASEREPTWIWNKNDNKSLIRSYPKSVEEFVVKVNKQFETLCSALQKASPPGCPMDCSLRSMRSSLSPRTLSAAAMSLEEFGKKVEHLLECIECTRIVGEYEKGHFRHDGTFLTGYWRWGVIKDVQSIAEWGTLKNNLLELKKACMPVLSVSPCLPAGNNILQGKQEETTKTAVLALNISPCLPVDNNILQEEQNGETKIWLNIKFFTLFTAALLYCVGYFSKK